MTGCRRRQRCPRDTGLSSRQAPASSRTTWAPPPATADLRRKDCPLVVRFRRSCAWHRQPNVVP
jgi:hypothetical protein